MKHKAKMCIIGIDQISKMWLMFLTRRRQKLLREDILVEFTDTTMPKKHDCLWYGGEVAVIHYRQHRFILSAIGDVYANLLDKQDGDRSIFYVKDKNNSGYLADEPYPYIKTDKELVAAIDGSHRRYHLVLDHNNWWECFLMDPEGEFHDMMLALDSNDIFDAIAEIIAACDEIIAYAAE